jgi:hypothetical protein
MPQNLPERYFLGRQGRVMWPSFFANVDFCFLRDRLQQLSICAATGAGIEGYDTLSIRHPKSNPQIQSP